METGIIELLNCFSPITLEEMGGIRLMNRIDTKYIMPLDKLLVFLEKAQSEYYVQEINSLRISRYSTIYFDTADGEMFIAHQNGKRARQKVRVRAYVDSNLNYFEIKHKNNKGRTNKKRIRIDKTEDISKNREVEDFIRTYAWYPLSALNRKVENNFKRITLVNKGKTERLTIDYDINFRNPETNNRANLENMVIVELKRDGYIFSPVRNILRQLNIKPINISKYCVGTILTNPSVKHNRFKIKLRQINKLTNTQIYG